MTDDTGRICDRHIDLADDIRAIRSELHETRESLDKKLERIRWWLLALTLAVAGVKGIDALTPIGCAMIEGVGLEVGRDHVGLEVDLEDDQVDAGVEDDLVDQNKANNRRNFE